jgi:Spo0E like sporulation regulatory protein.
MDELNKLLQDIENLRDNLYKLINDKENLRDPEVISASQILNATITKYNEIIEKKTK